jgi:endonuclease YncB( thermonuclease family)
MRSLFKYYFIFLWILFLPLAATAAPHKVLRVIDGDTIEVLYRGKAEKVNLLCVDTPDFVHKDEDKDISPGEKASKYTRMKLNNKVVDLEFEGDSRDIYGRLVAYVFVHGVNLNIELVRKGLSPYYIEYGNSRKYDDEFIEAETTAMDRKLGIWSDPELTRKYLSLKSEWERDLIKYDRAYKRTRSRSTHHDSVIIINPEPEETPNESEKKSVWPEKKTWPDVD